MCAAAALESRNQASRADADRMYLAERDSPESLQLDIAIVGSERPPMTANPNFPNLRQLKLPYWRSRGRMRVPCPR